ncbi:hypothetical protein TgHK011_005189 [Trichoderma gracile]|nr:hypothetical protein TgHK011_005189 [Trichoderma gracile]
MPLTPVDLSSGGIRLDPDQQDGLVLLGFDVAQARCYDPSIDASQQPAWRQRSSRKPGRYGRPVVEQLMSPSMWARGCWPPALPWRRPGVRVLAVVRESDKPTRIRFASPQHSAADALALALALLRPNKAHGIGVDLIYYDDEVLHHNAAQRVVLFGTSTHKMLGTKDCRCAGGNAAQARAIIATITD